MTATLRALLGLAPVPRGRFACATVLGALTVVFGVGLMATAGYLIARAAERPAILSLEVVIVGVRFFGLGRPVVRYVERLSSHDLALRMLTRVRTHFYARIVPLAPAELRTYREGDLLSRMVADVDALQNLTLRVLGPPIVATLAGAVSVGVAAAVLPAAGLVLAVGLLLGGIAVPALSGGLAARAGERQAAARGELSAELVGLLGGAPELTTFGATETALARVRAADAGLVATGRRDAGAAGLADGLGTLVTGITVCAVLALAVAASHAGQLDRVLVAMLTLLALASFEAVTPLAAAARELSVTLGAGRRILELTGRRPAVMDGPSPLPAPAWPFTVSFENVTARYSGQDAPVLEGFSGVLAAGERVALLGPSGSGKTTVANLLLRFLDPEAGRVTLAGRDLRDYRLADLPGVVAIAGQTSHLFSTSIRDNVRLGRPPATETEIEAALGRAQILDWVQALPDGLDTEVGELGHELSGGQRQRIALARALLSDAHVLVLDEPTAHLDPPTARDLVADVFAAAGERTVLLITHRDEGLELVDRVLTLGHGR